jgi:hypothetical protein
LDELNGLENKNAVLYASEKDDMRKQGMLLAGRVRGSYFNNTADVYLHRQWSILCEYSIYSDR